METGEWCHRRAGSESCQERKIVYAGRMNTAQSSWPRVQKSFAFLTAADFPNLSSDCLIGAEALRRRGMIVDPLVWDETPVEELKRYDLIVIRSIWDYQYKLEKFRAWLGTLAEQNISVLNPSALIKWNLSKRYLQELYTSHGLPIVPTVWIERDAKDFESHINACPGEKMIVKPEISASADLTFVFDRHQIAEITAAIQTIQKRSAVMLQPFCEEILTSGETSLVYFSDGQSFVLSHCVLKLPKPNDFRIQHEHGGIYNRIAATDELAALGERTLAAVTSDWLYARVDLVRYEGALRIGELELIEPQLYFRWAPEAAERFADCLLHRADAML